MTLKCLRIPSWLFTEWPSPCLNLLFSHHDEFGGNIQERWCAFRHHVRDVGAHLSKGWGCWLICLLRVLSAKFLHPWVTTFPCNESVPYKDHLRLCKCFSVDTAAWWSCKPSHFLWGRPSGDFPALSSFLCWHWVSPIDGFIHWLPPIAMA